MAYEVLARKWRPKQFSDVVGQEHVTRTLSHAIESGRVAHAYLFVGPRGIGKTSLSRIFAKALDCEQGPTITPCDNCDICHEVATGNSLDVIEIDAASNNGVDNVRDIRDSIQFAPTRAKYKIYIIDEVHMLTTGAFNALLKTLEEPPPHAKFIFATTEVDKLPTTIISRCQRFDLKRIPTSTIVTHLERISKEEGVIASRDALLAIARGAEGGMRDALGALDQIISFKGNSVTEEDVVAIFGLVPRIQLETLASAILSGDMAGGLKIIDELDKKGKDLRRLTVEMMGHFRNIAVQRTLGDGAKELLDVTPEQHEVLKAQAAMADEGRILRVIEHFADLEERIRYALSRRTIFETVFLRSCRAATTATLDQVIRKLSESGVAIPRQQPAILASAPAVAPAPPPPPARPSAMPPPPPARPSAMPPPPPARPSAMPPPPPARPSAMPPPPPVRPSAMPPPPPARPSQVAPKPEPMRPQYNPLLDNPVVKEAVKDFNGAVVNITSAQPPKKTN